jgi:hypothetical protein
MSFADNTWNLYKRRKITKRKKLIWLFDNFWQNLIIKYFQLFFLCKSKVKHWQITSEVKQRNEIECSFLTQRFFRSLRQKIKKCKNLWNKLPMKETVFKLKCFNCHNRPCLFDTWLSFNWLTLSHPTSISTWILKYSNYIY